MPSCRLSVAVLVLSALGAGCVPALPAPGNEGLVALLPRTLVAADGWWDNGYAFRRRVRISTTTGIGAGYAVRVDFDHRALILAGKSLANGNDFRFVRQTGGVPHQELDRVLDPASFWDTTATRVWVQAQASVPGNSYDETYYVYYGNSGAGTARQAPANVYTFFDSFDAGVLEAGWTLSAVGGPNCGASVSSSNLTVSSSTATDSVSTASDTICFASRTVSGDFVADSRTTGAVGGVSANTRQYGGVMVRESVAVGSILTAAALSLTSSANVLRSTEGTTASVNTVSLASYQRVARSGTSVARMQSTDGLNFTSADGPQSLTLPHQVLVGPYLGMDETSTHSMTVDWFRIRPFVSPEPTVSAGAEEVRP